MPINVIKNDIIISLPAGNQIPMSVLIGALNQIVDDYYLELGDKVDVVAGQGLSQENFTTILKDKLDNLISGYVGFYADEAALNSAHPTGISGEYAQVGSTDTLWTWDADTGAWVNSGTTSMGDMLKATYDPTNINGSAFDMDNMTESGTKIILTDVERSQFADAFGWGDHGTEGYLKNTDILFGSFKVYKASGNFNKGTLETNDVIQGIWSISRFWVAAIYNGGTITNEANYTIKQEILLT